MVKIRHCCFSQEKFTIQTTSSTPVWRHQMTVLSSAFLLKWILQRRTEHLKTPFHSIRLQKKKKHFSDVDEFDTNFIFVLTFVRENFITKKKFSPWFLLLMMAQPMIFMTCFPPTPPRRSRSFKKKIYKKKKKRFMISHLRLSCDGVAQKAAAAAAYRKAGRIVRR